MSPFYNFQHTNIVGDYFSNYGGFGVDIFFVISGFIIMYSLSNKKKEWKSFFLRRIIRIAPNYWIWTILTVMIGLVVNTLYTENVTWKSMVLSLLFISHEHTSGELGDLPILTVGWTLNLEMFFCSFVTLILGLNLKIKSMYYLVGIFFLSLPIIYSMSNITFYNSVFENFRLIEFTSGTILAYLYAYHKETFDGYIIKLLTIIVVFAVLQLNLALKLNCIIISFFLLYLFLQMESSFVTHRKRIQFFLFVGEISFSVYLIHSIVIRVLFYVFQELTSVFEVAIVLSLSILLTILIAWTSYILIEKKLSIHLKNILFK